MYFVTGSKKKKKKYVCVSARVSVMIRLYYFKLETNKAKIMSKCVKTVKVVMDMFIIGKINGIKMEPYLLKKCVRLEQISFKYFENYEQSIKC